MDIKQALLDLGYSVTDAGKSYRMRPLYRDSDSNNVLSVLKSNGHWCDFSADKKGVFLELVALTLGLKDLNEARSHLENHNFNFDLTDRVEKEKINSPSYFDIKEMDKITNDYSYWEGRGISEKILKEFKNGVCKKGKMKSRSLFPIYGNEKILGFSGRDISGNSPLKWKHLGTKSFWVYPYHLNKNDICDKKEVILVESIGDCLSLFEVGIRNVLVLFGINLSNSILKKLIQIDPDKIYISLNNDSEKNSVGNRAAEEMKKRLSLFFDESQVIIKLPNLKDFNEMLLENREELKEFYDSTT